MKILALLSMCVTSIVASQLSPEILLEFALKKVNFDTVSYNGPLLRAQAQDLLAKADPVFGGWEQADWRPGFCDLFAWFCCCCGGCSSPCDVAFIKKHKTQDETLQTNKYLRIVLDASRIDATFTSSPEKNESYLWVKKASVAKIALLNIKPQATTGACDLKK